MKILKNISWISFDADFLGGSHTSSDIEYSCIKKCPSCYEKQGRPRTQILSKKEAELNTMEIIQLINSCNIQKAYLRQCHASIIHLIHNGDDVYNIDAHHDYYSIANTKKEVNCGNWVDWARKHNIMVKSPCAPLQVEKILKKSQKPICLFICTSPNYASPQTDANLMEILYNIKCKINTDFTK